MTDPRSGSCPPYLLVTGSSGLIGSQLVRELSLDHFAIGLDVKRPPQHIPGTIWIECDLSDDKSVRQAMHKVGNSYGKNIISVVHLAAYYDFSGEPSPLYEELTVNGTARLLDALAGFEVGQFAFASSLLVMKPVAKGERLTEGSPVEAEWEYPESKLRTEGLLRERRGEIPVAIARLAGVYDDDCHSIPIAQQIKRLYDRDFKSHFFPGNADHGQSFVHLSDAINFFKRLILNRRDLSPWEVFLAGEPDVMSYGELQDAISEEIYGEPSPTIPIPKAMAKAGAWVEENISSNDQTFVKPWMIDLADAHYPVDISKARDRVGWEPRHRLRETLPVMIAQLKAGPVAWHETNNLTVPDALLQEETAR